MKPFVMFVLLLLATGCSGKQSMAEKSAEAFREADAKGIAVRGDGHAHHDDATAMTATEAHAGMQQSAPSIASDPHAAHRGTAASSAAGSEHAAHEGMQHSAAPYSGSVPHAAHREASTQPAGDPHAAHRGASAQPAGDPHAAHSGASAQPFEDPHAAHRAEGGEPLAHEAPGIQPGAASLRAGGAAMAGGTPAPQETLKPDAFDAPVPISVREAAKSAPPAEQGLYTCPMHPEVTSDQPGKCPKCGMTLVEKKR